MKFRPTLLALGLGAIAIAMSAGATAEGNVENGKTLAYTCHGCHGIPNYRNAWPSFTVPRLGNQSLKYISVALAEYASGERSHPTMRSQAVSLSAQDREDIAAFLHAEGANPEADVIGTPPPATQTCVQCHGANGAKPLSDDYPVLAGQYANYLVHALKDYKSGKRKNPIMAGIIAGVDEKDFDALAQFFAQQKGLCGTEEIRKHGKCSQK
ncbi:c-type cytochrome [Povalibacter sp.]|uniref:c-type cytochrome n=1 Tax=Povalibacter sp. TaxID=1962978 RepID=UPI002F3ED920